MRPVPPFFRIIIVIRIFYHPLCLGSPDKSRWIIDCNQSGKLQRPVWKAVHIACDVGNRIHTRHDSDEDVRGNACNLSIAWKALPWSFIIQTFFLRYT